MTGPTRRSLEKRVDALADDLGDGDSLLVAYRDARTGELETPEGEPVDADDHGADQLIIIEESVVMARDDAEREGREILGPATGEDIPAGRDLVEVCGGGAHGLRD